MLLAAAPGVTGAGKNASTAVATVHKVQACVIRPFDRLYVDVAVQEKRARQKVSKRCQEKEGKLSIFCKEQSADCSTVSIKIPK